MHHHSRSSSGRQSSIFDPEYSQFPNPQFMSQFIQLFFQHLGSEYPFIKYEDVAGDFMERRMSVALSNSIAALAVQCVLFHPFPVNVDSYSVQILGLTRAHRARTT